jgi:hypothetical protein
MLCQSEQIRKFPIEFRVHLQIDERLIMKSTQLLLILVGVSFFNQICSLQTDEKDTKKCCEPSETSESTNCTETCGDKSPTTGLSDQEENSDDPSNQDSSNTVICYGWGLQCRKGYRMTKSGRCRKVI